MAEATAALREVADYSPYFAVGQGPTDGDGWSPLSTLLDSSARTQLIDGVAQRMGTDEIRVAASSAFFGLAARLWSVALGTIALDGRCIDLDPDHLLWSDDSGIALHIVEPRWGDELRSEVVEGNLAPIITAWRPDVAPGLLWGNAASGLRGAAHVITGRKTNRPDGPRRVSRVEQALATVREDSRLREAVDAESGRRRSCCLYYRLPGAGVCGDCVFTLPPTRPIPKPV